MNTDTTLHPAANLCVLIKATLLFSSAWNLEFDPPMPVSTGVSKAVSDGWYVNDYPSNPLKKQHGRPGRGYHGRLAREKAQ
jgi:hypothetical protein